IRAAQAVFLVAPEPERHAAVRAELVDQAEAILRVAKCYEFFRKNLYPDGRAIGLGQLGGEQRRQPVAAEELAHRRARAGAGQQFVLFRSHERGSSIWSKFKLLPIGAKASRRQGGTRPWRETPARSRVRRPC